MEFLKNIKKNTLLLLLITSIVLFFLLKDNFDEIVKALSSMDYKYILLAIFFFFAYLFFKSVANYRTINDKQRVSLLEAFKHDVIVQFFNGVTPFSTGGQPMEIYMLTEHDIKATKAADISIQNFIFYQTALVIYGVSAVTYNYFFHIFPKAELLRKLVLLGFVINSLVALGLLLLLVSKPITKKITQFFINILYKVKIIKNKEKTKEKVFQKLDEFHDGASELRKRKGLFLTGVILNLLSLTCLYIIPLFIVYSLHDFTSITVLETLTASAYVLLMGSFVPIPGASGGIEFGFMQFYGNFIGSSVLPAILIVWRFITYYVPMIVGALVFSLEKKVKE